MTPYYQHAGVTIYHGDCREILPILAFGSIVTDVPYGIGKDYGDGCVDNLDTFQWAVRLIAGAGVPACTTVPVSRIFDIPVKPQWVGVWEKPLGMMGLAAYPIYPHWEPIPFWNIKGDYLGNKGHRSDVYKFAPAGAQDSDHPTPKPTSLAAALIAHIGRGIICDPFIGSGTTLIAAKTQGCNAIGIEIEERYCEIAAKRLSQEVLPYSTPTLNPTAHEV